MLSNDIKPTADQVAEVARLAARLVLENGGETYRAEDTARHIAKAYDFDTDIIAFPTGLTMTLTGKRGNSSMIARVMSITVDLTRLEQVNSVSRRVADGKMTLDEAKTELERIRDQKPVKMWKNVVYAGFSAAMFALMFGGNWFDFALSGLCGALIQLILTFIPDQAGGPVSSLLGGFLSSLLALVGTMHFGMGDVNRIIVSTLMPFLPGLAFTNAIRDTMRGDLLSGNARLFQALMKAIVLAGGAGAGLWLYLAMGGVAP